MSSSAASQASIPVQQYNPMTGHLDSQVYFPVMIEGFGLCYYIDDHWVSADPNYNQQEWSHNYHANQSSPLLPDEERPPYTVGEPSRVYTAKQILDLYKKSDTHYQWKNKEQKHGNAVPNGTWGSFEIEAGKIFRNCTLPKTKKMPRVRNHRELIAWMQEEYKDGENSSRRLISEKLPTHHGVVYDKWKSNKDRRDAAERESNSLLNQEINEEGERAKVVIYQDGDESILSQNCGVDICEGGEGKENDDSVLSEKSQKVKKTQKSPRKPFGVKN